MRSTLSKFCVVLLTLAGACTSSALQTADTWAQRVCRLVLAVPVASESVLPPNVSLTVAVTPSIAVVVVASETPPGKATSEGDAGSSSDSTAPTASAVVQKKAFAIPLPTLPSVSPVSTPSDSGAE